jgi:hypothetical protein
MVLVGAWGVGNLLLCILCGAHLGEVVVESVLERF